MSDIRVTLKEMNFRQTEHLPVVAAFCRSTCLPPGRPPCWDGKIIHKPTSFMMTTKFKGVLLAGLDGKWGFT